MTDRPRRLMLQRTGPAFGHAERLEKAVERLVEFLDEQGFVAIEKRTLIEAEALLAEHIPHLSAAVRCALRQALGKPNG